MQIEIVNWAIHMVSPASLPTSNGLKVSWRVYFLKTKKEMTRYINFVTQISNGKFKIAKNCKNLFKIEIPIKKRIIENA